MVIRQGWHASVPTAHAQPVRGFIRVGKLLLWDRQLRRLTTFRSTVITLESQPKPLKRLSRRRNRSHRRSHAALGRADGAVATPRRPRAHAARGQRRSVPSVLPCGAFGAAPDSTVLLDASLEFGPHHAPRLLAGADRPIGAALPVNVLSGLEHIRTPERYVAAGPLVARVRAGRFLDITLTRTVVPIFRTDSVVRDIGRVTRADGSNDAVAHSSSLFGHFIACRWPSVHASVLGPFFSSFRLSEVLLHLLCRPLSPLV